MPTPECNQAFRVEKFMYIELPGIGKGAVGQERGGSCSAFTRPMLIEPEGQNDEERRENLEKLKEMLEAALATRKD